MRPDTTPSADRREALSRLTEMERDFYEPLEPLETDWVKVFAWAAFAAFAGIVWTAAALLILPLVLS